MKLSILDQSPVRQGDSARQALQETIALAQHGEALGYHRFWVSEHHNTTMLAGSAPEVLLAAIGAATDSIRIGSGGVMLPHYSALKVAEAFSLLSNLYPNRIDLGVGRAPGSDMNTARALATDGRPKFERFPILVEQLRRMLHSGCDENQPSSAAHTNAGADFRTEQNIKVADTQPIITPAADYPPPVWILGSSHESAILAAHNGLPYNFALFINSQMVPELFELYRQEFQPSAQLAEPKTMLTVNTICADTETDAQRIAMSRRLGFLRFAKGQKGIKVPPIEEAEAYSYSDEENRFLDAKFTNAAIGDPQQVKQKLTQLATDFGTDEIMTVTITYDFAARLRSYTLMAEAFELAPRQNTGANEKQMAFA